MRKIVIFLTCISMLFCCGCYVPSETKVGGTGTDLKNPGVDYGPDIIASFSLDDFHSKLSSSITQSANTNKLLQMTYSQNLNFDAYAISYIGYNRSKSDDGNYNGNESIDISWHKTNCELCEESYNLCREEFRMHLIYMPGGIDRQGATKGYSETGISNLYIKKLSNEKTSYIFFFSNQYSCRFVITDNDIDKEGVTDQLIIFCQESKAAYHTGTMQ